MLLDSAIMFSGGSEKEYWENLHKEYASDDDVVVVGESSGQGEIVVGFVIILRCTCIEDTHIVSTHSIHDLLIHDRVLGRKPA
jgi:hypothetical protein